MMTKATIRLLINSSERSHQWAQWIAEEVRDYALTVVGVREAHIVKVEEVDEHGEG